MAAAQSQMAVIPYTLDGAQARVGNHLNLHLRSLTSDRHSVQARTLVHT